jgi:polyphosphate glucokinase
VNLSSDTESIFAVDVGATSIKAALVGHDGVLQAKIHRRRTQLPIRPEQLVSILEQMGSRFAPFSDAVVGFPGLVHDGSVKSPDNLAVLGAPGSPPDRRTVAEWIDFDLRDVARKRLGVPVTVVNDADVAAMGCAKGRGRELTVTLGTGVGTGFVIDGRLQDHVEYPLLECFGEGEVDVMVGEFTRKSLDQATWEQRVHLVLGELIEKFSCEQCYVAGGNARRLRRDRLHQLAVPVWVVDRPVGLLGAAGIVAQA